jgi:hypothetical protein
MKTDPLKVASPYASGSHAWSVEQKPDQDQPGRRSWIRHVKRIERQRSASRLRIKQDAREQAHSARHVHQ